ncbi:hypothetical protein [Klebsiella pneumoniae]|jgi:hypothetical protein|uniref:hypothetical protein n=1 Tax=Klebsiella pneumoniae TaxID=573 RepID=UPI000E2C2F74|nr:hypothetical protein [Klebsiella pneumoniae]SXL17340.1 Uncharacterised protein [Klebsiella pneumoniae]HBZ4191448.1 hypothetical protein [Klebsiella pneumoniae]HBZ4229750.1 hypothetical protein [Klebsiella pneumoniae]HDZ1667981.1 hypothetical protein [Klebsiella pneumoniae]
MNIETVNELIQSLESAGELSIREQKFLKLAKAYQQLAAENVGLIRSAECLLHEASEVYRAYNKTQLPDGDLVDGQSLQEVWDAINATPATDAYLAGIKADGVEEFIGRLQQHVDEGDFVDDEVAVIVGAIDCGKEFCEQLREGVK